MAGHGRELVCFSGGQQPSLQNSVLRALIAQLMDSHVYAWMFCTGVVHGCSAQALCRICYHEFSLPFFVPFKGLFPPPRTPRPATPRHAAMASQEIVWECLKRSSCFLRKGGAVAPVFSAEPGNLMNKHSFKFSGAQRLVTPRLRGRYPRSASFRAAPPACRRLTLPHL